MGYKRISNNGYIEYEHRIVASKMIGRTLLDEEEVHHIDFNKQNNDPENLIIFSTKKDHQRYHGGGTLIPNNDGTYRCELKTVACPICNKDFHPECGQVYCSKVCAQQGRANNRPSKEELYELLKSQSFNSVGAMFGVSSNSIRKWCKSYGIPHNSEHYKEKKIKPKSRIKRLSEEQKDEVKALYAKGMSQLDLAKKFNVTRWQIRTTLNKDE